MRRYRSSGYFAGAIRKLDPDHVDVIEFGVVDGKMFGELFFKKCVSLLLLHAIEHILGVCGA